MSPIIYFVTEQTSSSYFSNKSSVSKIFSTTKYKHHHLDEVTAGVVDIVQGVKAEQVSQDFSDRKRALNFREEFSEAANHVLHVISLHKKNKGSRDIPLIHSSNVLRNAAKLQEYFLFKQLFSPSLRWPTALNKRSKRRALPCQRRSQDFSFSQKRRAAFLLFFTRTKRIVSRRQVSSTLLDRGLNWWDRRATPPQKRPQTLKKRYFYFSLPYRFGKPCHVLRKVEKVLMKQLSPLNLPYRFFIALKTMFCETL